MAMPYSDQVHWRDSARSTRFFFIDYRALFPLLICLFHPNRYTLIFALVAVVFFCALERYGFTVIVFLRWLRSVAGGAYKPARPWWSREHPHA